jgi:hypothetical protein
VGVDTRIASIDESSSSSRMSSSESFGVYVWGWGTPETRAGLNPACGIDLPGNTCDISYGYPAGENLVPLPQLTAGKLADDGGMAKGPLRGRAGL